MPLTYRMYPNIISSPPLHVPLLLHCKITFSKKIRFLLLTKYWESFLNMDQMEATFHYIPIFQKNQRTQTNCVCVCVSVCERESFPFVLFYLCTCQIVSFLLTFPIWRERRKNHVLKSFLLLNMQYTYFHHEGITRD